MRWQPGPHYGQLTLVVVAHDLVTLAYPFIESFASALPLGCRYLVGAAACTDDTVAYYGRLARYAPLDIVAIPWRTELAGGAAIGWATQALIGAAATPWVYNLQAAEVLCDDLAATLVCWPGLRPGWARFRHFFGGMAFDGSLGGHGYGAAPRLFERGCVDLANSDGCWPSDWTGPESPADCLGWIHRYGWTWDNQIQRKMLNHYSLYHGAAQTPEARLWSIDWCRRNSNYQGEHPAIVSHLHGQRDYDIERNMEHVLSRLEAI